jgi:pimeloyl-ACP methyl ester carboxylesterase
MPDLLAVERGSGETPVVFLHGFGFSHAVWDDLLAGSACEFRSVAFDLPGHAASLAYPPGSAGAAARAVLAALKQRGVYRAHLVGHSMGGAAAALAALMAPRQAASLTLLAPGGFGPEINHRLLRRYAAATEEAEIARLLEQFFGWDHAPPKGFAAELAKQRSVAGATAALMTVVETFFDGNVQKTFATDELAGLGIPVKVLWGRQDGVLPTRQAYNLPGRIAVHIFERAGHMLPQEIAADAMQLILQNIR